MPSSTSLRAWRNPHDRRVLATLWAGMLAGPLVFLTLLEANYVLSYVSCETRQTWFLHAPTLGGAALVAVVGFLCWTIAAAGRHVDEIDGGPAAPGTAQSRAVWMGYAGAATSAWFVIVILSMHVPVLVLKTCQ